MTLRFERALPSIIRSIRQRDLLNAWMRLDTGLNTLPRFAGFESGGMVDEILDVVNLKVVRDGDQTRFIIISAENMPMIDTAQTPFMDVLMGAAQYSAVLPYYQACLEHRRPIYSVSIVKDDDGKEVSYERLLLPFGEHGTIDHISGSYKRVNIEGGFKVKDLEKLIPGATVSVTRAIIDGHAPSLGGAGQPTQRF
jgi:hypothetical protein